MKWLEWPQHISHYKSMGIFLFAQGQRTPQPLVWSGLDSNSVQTLWLSLLPERMRKIRSKMGAQEWPQGFPHYDPMGAICCHGNQSSNLISPKTQCSLSPTPMIRLLKYDCDRHTGCRGGDIHVWKCGHTDTHTDTLTDRRRLDWYTISSPCEPSAQVSLKSRSASLWTRIWSAPLFLYLQKLGFLMTHLFSQTTLFSTENFSHHQIFFLFSSYKHRYLLSFHVFC